MLWWESSESDSDQTLPVAPHKRALNLQSRRSVRQGISQRSDLYERDWVFVRRDSVGPFRGIVPPAMARVSLGQGNGLGQYTIHLADVGSAGSR